MIGVVAIVAVTIIAGAFVAGMDAGLLYNEYPLMGDGLVPIEYGEEGLSDPFDNPAAAQFHHRWVAVLAVIGVLTLWRRARLISPFVSEVILSARLSLANLRSASSPC